MSLKRIPLDPFLLAGLYSPPLVPLISGKRSVDEKVDRAITFLGNNERHITLLVFNENETWLPDALFAFLTKILQACGLSMNDVALINYAVFPEVSIPDLVQQTAPQKMILFGASLQRGLKLSLEKNKVQKAEQMEVLYTEELGELKENKQLKKAFWAALQDLFGLKKQT